MGSFLEKISEKTLFGRLFNNTLFVIGILLLWSSVILSHAETITIGTGTTTGTHLPTEPYYDYSYTEQIFLQSEIDTKGRIDTISFYWNGNSTTSRTIEIWMGHTTKSSYANDSDWVETDNGMTLVFNGSYSLTSTAGWHDIVLTTPFFYNNSDNLIIGCDDNTNSYVSGSDEFYATSKGAYRSIYAHQDNTNILSYDPTPKITTQARSTYSPNLRLKINTDYIVVGTGTSVSQHQPSELQWDYSYTQQIYLQSELDAG